MRLYRTLAAAVTLCLAVAISSCGGDDPAAPEPNPTPTGPLVFDDFQPAAVIIGQPNGTASATGLSAATLNQPTGDLAAGGLYVCDFGNNRVLGFNATPTADGAGANFVVGQADFMSNTSGVSASRFSPFDVRSSGGKLFVVDYVNNRVLIWNTMPGGDVPANIVIGQADFADDTARLTQSGLDTPVRVQVAGGKMFVLDYNNHRCLIWNSVPSTNNAPADVVVGQMDFVSRDVQRDAYTPNFPTSMWTDGTRLLIGDFWRRILVWNTIPTSNYQPADFVIGAPDLDSVGNVNAWGLASDGTNLYVAETDGSRVLIYRPIPTANGALPSGVLGQSDLAHFTRNDDNQDGIVDATPSGRTFGYPTSVTIIGRKLYVTDQGNNRVMVFNSR
ncbi:MAG: hypothetical protein OEX18_15055 [Candidatus Krumholzibacteria bacterium]|nr:hypothetical protein [Candidatus Krumholzibacteria bacterium]MDH4338586.1 hypothetical protein [Candidatus Krumholzibacteria bacterium]MDH5271235.1 hypothetical protein [Candidatus Krumholzibacteria bacterium]